MGKYVCLSILAVFCSGFLLFSCASAPAERPELPAANLPAEAVPPSEKAPERPSSPEQIMGTGKVPTEKLTVFLVRHNPETDMDFAQELAGYYVEEAVAEGVNHDVAFAQMCLETGYLNYGGLVTPEMNNFCGLGSIGMGHRGAIFPDPRTGVRAHIQHLKAYASEEPLNQMVVDPRYRWVRRGSAPTLYGLSGTWAADKRYGDKLVSILGRLYDFSFDG